MYVIYMAFHQDSNTRSIQGRCSNITGPDRVYVAVLMKYPVHSTVAIRPELHLIPFKFNGLLHEFQPGRVATLIDEPQSKTYGVAYQLLGDSALEYLNMREVTLGGYVNHMTTFYPAAATGNKSNIARSPFPVLLFMATPSNDQWLGSAPLEDIAEQVKWWWLVGCFNMLTGLVDTILTQNRAVAVLFGLQVVHSSGKTGHNVEYVLKLAAWSRSALPDIIDEHLYELEKHILSKVKF